VRWPWVSRATYDQHTQVLIDAQAGALHQQDRLLDLYESLLDKYHALVMGETVTAATPALAPVPLDAVTEAIHQKAGTDVRLRGIMAEQVARDRADGLTEDEIVRRIYNGERDSLQPAQGAAA
jgi:hypothetical protein